MMSSNAIIGFPRYTRAVTWTALNNAWTAAYPPAHLANDEELARVARSAGTATSQTGLLGTLPQPQPVGLVVLCQHNLSVAAQWQVKLFYGDDLVQDSGMVDVWPAVYSPQDLAWEQDNWWSCTPSQSDVQGYPWHLPYTVPSGQVWADSIQIQISDSTHPDGFVQIGLVEISDQWQLPVNYSYGASTGYVDNSDPVESASGSKFYSSSRRSARTFTGAINYMDQSSARSRLQEMHRQLGQHTPFFWMMEPANAMDMFRTAWLARFSSLDDITQVAYGLTDADINLEEVI